MAFTSAPILKYPDPTRPLTVEVYGLEMGIGGVLPQHFREKPKLHPVFFFFSSPKKLTPAKQNYAIGHRELLAIKLDLEEWRHWFEGAAHSFIILTAHKKTIKQINPQQAIWAHFFFPDSDFPFNSLQVQRTLKLKVSPGFTTSLTSVQSQLPFYLLNASLKQSLGTLTRR